MNLSLLSTSAQVYRFQHFRIAVTSISGEGENYNREFVLKMWKKNPSLVTSHPEA